MTPRNVLQVRDSDQSEVEPYQDQWPHTDTLAMQCIVGGIDMNWFECLKLLMLLPLNGAKICQNEL